MADDVPAPRVARSSICKIVTPLSYPRNDSNLTFRLMSTRNSEDCLISTMEFLKSLLRTNVFFQFRLFLNFAIYLMANGLDLSYVYCHVCPEGPGLLSNVHAKIHVS